MTGTRIDAMRYHIAGPRVATLVAAALGLGLWSAGRAEAQFGAAGAAAGAHAAGAAGGFGAGAGGNAAAMGALGTGNAFPAMGGAQGGAFNALFSNGFGTGIGSGGLVSGQAFQATGSFNPLLGNPAGNNAFGFNPAGNNVFNPLLANPAGPNAFLTPGTNANFNIGTNPLLGNLSGNSLPGLTNTGSAFTNPLLGNLSGNSFPGINPAATTSYNPLLANPAGNNVIGFNPALNGFNNPFGTTFFSGLNPSVAGPFGPLVPGFGNGGAAGGTSGTATLAITYNPFLTFYNGYYPHTFNAGGYDPSYYPYYYGGYTPYATALNKYDMYSLYGNRYGVGNGNLLPGYAAANFYGPIAMATDMANYRRVLGALSPRFSIPRRHTTRGTTRTAAAPANDLLPRDQLFDKDGNIRWPSSAPDSPLNLATSRRTADRAIKDVERGAGKNGRAPVRDVVLARDKLEDYGRPAMEKLRSAGDERGANELGRFLESLDRALVQLSEAPRTTAAAGATHINPDSAPKTAGEVLKNSLPPASGDATAPATPKAKAQPKSAADVLKDATKKD
jgi:hypothetical protein